VKETGEARTLAQRAGNWAKRAARGLAFNRQVVRIVEQNFAGPDRFLPGEINNAHECEFVVARVPPLLRRRR
jgi:hypothetical protein